MSLFEGLQGSIMTGAGDTPWFSISSGVRQGDVISPYLFLFFIDHGRPPGAGISGSGFSAAGAISSVTNISSR